VLRKCISSKTSPAKEEKVADLLVLTTKPGGKIIERLLRTGVRYQAGAAREEKVAEKVYQRPNSSG